METMRRWWQRDLFHVIANGACYDRFFEIIGHLQHLSGFIPDAGFISTGGDDQCRRKPLCFLWTMRIFQCRSVPIFGRLAELNMAPAGRSKHGCTTWLTKHFVGSGALLCFSRHPVNWYAVLRTIKQWWVLREGRGECVVAERCRPRFRTARFWFSR